MRNSIQWIELVRRPERQDRNFAGKAHAFNAGFERVRSLEFDVIGNLDADISFERDYFEFLLSKFAEFPRLGVAGTAMREASYDPIKDSFYHDSDVFGACQLFRRECFEEVGGYTPIKWGGIDWIAVRTARLKGWQTRSFCDKIFLPSSANGSYGKHNVESKIRLRQKGLLPWKPPVLAGLQSRLPNAEAALCRGGTTAALGILLLLCVSHAKTSSAGTAKIPSPRAA